jgi:ribosomal protein S18 acetylase RimI-like enzyme
MTDRPFITSLHERDFNDFIAYLNDHLADNGGADAGYFQPLARGRSSFPADRATAFRSGLETAVGAKGWRRAWVARATDGRIAGHVDLRAHAVIFAEHRCLLGMGVDRHRRRAGLGLALIEHARQWAATVAKLEWIDLQVIGQNRAAIGLYQRAGFIGIGEIPDMFRIDGKSFSYATMSLQLRVR